MKVLVVGVNYAPEPTGIAPYTAAMAAGLAARMHRVRVITTMPHYPEWRVRDGYDRWSSTEAIGGARVDRVRHYVPSRPSGVRRLLSEVTFGVRTILSRWGRPDVVVLVSPAMFSSAIAALRARLLGIPTVVWLQDLYSVGVVETQGHDSAGAVARLITSVESDLVSRADAVCVIHDRFAEVAQQLGARRDRVHTVRNWSHLPNASALPAVDIRPVVGWGQDEIIALHSGAMGRKQDLDNVVAAARLAAERGAPVRFVLMGGGGERVRLEAAAGGLPTLQFLDPLATGEYQAALQAADVLVVNEHPGLREMAVPSKLTSYFSSGRPIVAATDAASVTASEIDASGGGVVVRPGDPAALLDAVLALHADPQRASRLGRNGRRYREMFLTPEAALDRFTALLISVVARQGVPVTDALAASRGSRQADVREPSLTD